MIKSFNYNIGMNLIRALILIIILLTSYLGFSSVIRFEQISANVFGRSLPAYEKLTELRDSYAKINSSRKALLIPGLDRIKSVPNELKTINTELATSDAIVVELNKLFERNSKLSAEEKQNWSELNTSFDKFTADIEQYKDKISAYHSTGNDELYKIAYDFDSNVLSASYSDINALLVTQIDMSKANMNTATSKTIGNSFKTYVFLAFTLLLSLFILICVSIFSMRFMSKPFTRKVTVLSRLSNKLSSASERVLAANRRLADDNTEFTAYYEETSAAFKKLASELNKRDADMQNAISQSNEIKALAAGGINKTDQIKNSIADIKASVTQTAKLMDIIDEVAFHINILTINASVEAARAGDPGQSFSVVADEIRTLTQKSAQAAKDIKTIIENNHKLTESCVKDAEEYANALDQISEQALKLNTAVAEIAASDQNLAQDIDEVGAAIAVTDKIIRSGTENVSQSVSATEELNAHSLELIRLSEDISKLLHGPSGIKNKPAQPPITEESFVVKSESTKETAGIK